MTDVIKIVDYTPDAQAFVVDSLTRSYYEQSTKVLRPDLAQFAFNRIGMQLALPVLREWILYLLSRGKCKLAVAEGRLDVYVGWAIVRENTLEYVFVKRAARQQGIARDLINSFGPDVNRVGSTTATWTKRHEWIKPRDPVFKRDLQHETGFKREIQREMLFGSWDIAPEDKEHG